MDALQAEACDFSQASPGIGDKDAFINAHFEGWELYPTNLDTYDPMITNGESYDSHLRGLSSTLFLNLPSSTSVDIIDLYGQKRTIPISL